MFEMDRVFPIFRKNSSKMHHISTECILMRWRLMRHSSRIISSPIVVVGHRVSFGISGVFVSIKWTVLGATESVSAQQTASSAATADGECVIGKDSGENSKQ